MATVPLSHLQRCHVELEMMQCRPVILGDVKRGQEEVEVVRGVRNELRVITAQLRLQDVAMIG